MSTFLKDSEEICRNLATQEDKISEIADTIFSAWKNNKWVFIVGNGGSASNATHFVGDLVKTVVDSPEQKGVKALGLNDNIPLVSAGTNDWGWGDAYTAGLNSYWEEGSVVVAFSVHGGSGSDKAGSWSQNLLKTLQYAKDNGGKAIGFSGFDGGAMRKLCDTCVVVEKDSTPLVEGFHAVVFHAVVFRLRELIQNHYSNLKN